MNINCYIVVDGAFETAVFPEKLLVQLAKSLRTKGKEAIHFADRSVVVEGLYIPAKGAKPLMVIPMEEVH